MKTKDGVKMRCSRHTKSSVIVLSRTIMLRQREDKKNSHAEFCMTVKINAAVNDWRRRSVIQEDPDPQHQAGKCIAQVGANRNIVLIGIIGRVRTQLLMGIGYEKKILKTGLQQDPMSDQIGETGGEYKIHTIPSSILDIIIGGRRIRGHQAFLCENRKALSQCFVFP